MASTDEKKRTQEASETNFTTRGGRQDATSGTGKPHTSPCKRAPEIPDEAGTFQVVQTRRGPGSGGGGVLAPRDQALHLLDDGAASDDTHT